MRSSLRLKIGCLRQPLNVVRARRAADLGAAVLLVFARVPALGLVKTRLAKTLGNVRALRIYRVLGHVVLRQMRRTMENNVSVRVVHTPDDGDNDIRAWLGPDIDTVPQGDGDLGARMWRAVAREFRAGNERVVVVGTDCPELSSAIVEQAFNALGTHDVVFGPASDGGYYLIGVHQRATNVALYTLFSGVPWSSSQTLSVSRSRARDAGLSVFELEMLSDIDSASDWRAWLERNAVRPAMWRT